MPILVKGDDVRSGTKNSGHGRLRPAQSLMVKEETDKQETMIVSRYESTFLILVKEVSFNNPDGFREYYSFLLHLVTDPFDFKDCEFYLFLKRN